MRGNRRAYMSACGVLLAAGVALGGSRVVAAPEGPRGLDTDHGVRAQQAVDRGVKYLLSVQQADGGWKARESSHPAVTALALKALMLDPAHGPEHPAVKRGLEFLLAHVQADGGIYVRDEGMNNYHTSVALMALAAARNAAHRETIRRAQDYLRALQWDEGEGHGSEDPWYGGQGYGSGKRPDLSNTQLMLDALHDSGLSVDDPAYRKAMAFISRCQMLGETNDQEFARGSVEGGFIYSPANGGESKAGVETVDGRAYPRSYGSMTYAGFKSMLYARLSRDDVRVRKAYDWIRRHYTLRQNPNMPEEQGMQGLFYYYHTFARALDAWGEDVLVDDRGMPHRWRAELTDVLIGLQKGDGSWVNPADRWMESNPHLVTAYGVLALHAVLERDRLRGG